MTTASPTSFTKAVQQIHDSMAGRASAEDVTNHLRATYPELYEAKAHSAILAQVGAALREKDDDGLPQRAAINNVYVRLDLFSVDEYRILISDKIRTSRQSIADAHKLAAKCEQQHGVLIDVEALLREEHAS